MGKIALSLRRSPEGTIGNQPETVFSLTRPLGQWHDRGFTNTGLQGWNDTVPLLSRFNGFIVGIPAPPMAIDKIPHARERKPLKRLLSISAQ